MEINSKLIDFSFAIWQKQQSPPAIFWFNNTNYCVNRKQITKSKIQCVFFFVIFFATDWDFIWLTSVFFASNLSIEIPNFVRLYNLYWHSIAVPLYKYTLYALKTQEKAKQWNWCFLTLLYDCFLLERIKVHTFKFKNKTYSIYWKLELIFLISRDLNCTFRSIKLLSKKVKKLF